MKIYISLRQTESGAFSFSLYSDKERTMLFEAGSVTLPNAFVALTYFNGLVAAAEGKNDIFDFDDESAIPMLNMFKDSLDMVRSLLT